MNQQRPPTFANAPPGQRQPSGNGTGGTSAGAPALNVGFLLTDNFTLSAFSLFVDHLRLAADEGDRSRPILARWQVMASNAEPVRASCGVTVAPTAPLLDPAPFNYIVVIGGLLHAGPQLDEATTAYLKRAARAGVSLVGICTGSFVLARAGLMTGRRCCVSWYHYQDFLEEFPHHTPVADRLYVIDGDRITCAGGGGAADLASALVERHIGRAVAQKGRHVLMLDRARPGNEAQPHPPIVDLVADDRVRRALILMEQHIADPLPIADIARRLQLSTRQLERLFQSVMGQRPAEFYRRIRLRYARFLLDTTARSVTDIALESGFSDCAHFSRQFKALHGFTPSDARAANPAAAQTQAAQRLFD
ncbi:GlxA family transcriptional regulator [Ancylobacter sp. 6x-1]|uniref:GlxA family transcriptional regulator n=1 Tax=Ancylobacter crimeensis TaxID=2579147 RepID=A0ABT0DEI1_9HYPH|nr:GlxA family transcriptional regulator [Ancylobacter crimeensis]MCK0198359.1 GlxA family transcriptional regulator [Ancylobacter crimeensis]